jgi:hypothetical protein
MPLNPKVEAALCAELGALDVGELRRRAAACRDWETKLAVAAAAEDASRAAAVGFGRIVVSETDVSNMLVNLV